jgi:hypothetical protein
VTVKEFIFFIGDKLLFDNVVTNWIEKESEYLNGYVADCCNPEHIPKKITVFVVVRFILLVSVTAVFAVFANLLAIPLCLLDDDCSGRSYSKKKSL